MRTRIRKPTRSGWGLLAVLTLAAGLVGCAGANEGGVVSDNRPVFFPPSPEMSRVQFLCHLSGTAGKARPRNTLLDFVAGPEEDDGSTRLGKPYGIVASNGHLYVADAQIKGVAAMDMLSRELTVFGQEGPGKLEVPINVRRSPSGHFFVTDSQRAQIVVFDSDGHYVTEYGEKGDFRPADVLVADGELYVLDLASHSIKVYDIQTHKLKRSLGGKGKAPGQFHNPTNMVMDGDGNLYVSDMLNFRIQKLDRNGKVLLQFGQAGDTPGRFSRPKGIAVGPDGIIYVVDSMFGVVQMFDRKGLPLMHFGERGTESGQMLLPTQITLDFDHVEVFRKYISPDFDAEYLIFVTNQYGANKISVFAFGQGKPPARPEVHTAVTFDTPSK